MSRLVIMPRKTTRGQGHKKDMNPLYILAYVLIWLSGIVVYMISKPSEKRLRFNALQAVFLGIIITLVCWIPFIGWVAGIVLWIIGIVVGAKAYTGEDTILPIIGKYAKMYS